METSELAGMPLFEMDVPLDIEAMWIECYETWKKQAIEQPVSVQWKAKDGAVNTTTVHILGTVNGNPTNFRAIAEVVKTIKPNAICIETQDTSLNKAVANSPRMQPLLTRLIETPISGVRQAHKILITDREQYERGMAAGSIALNPSDAINHYLLGQLHHPEFLAAAFVCRKMSLSLVAIDDDAEATALFREAEMMKSDKTNPREGLNLAILLNNQAAGVRVEHWISSEHGCQPQHSIQNAFGFPNITSVKSYSTRILSSYTFRMKASR